MRSLHVTVLSFAIIACEQLKQVLFICGKHVKSPVIPLIPYTVVSLLLHFIQYLSNLTQVASYLHIAYKDVKMMLYTRFIRLAPQCHAFAYIIWHDYHNTQSPAQPFRHFILSVGIAIITVGPRLSEHLCVTSMLKAFI